MTKVGSLSLVKGAVVGVAKPIIRIKTSATSPLYLQPNPFKAEMQGMSVPVRIIYNVAYSYPKADVPVSQFQHNAGLEM